MNVRILLIDNYDSFTYNLVQAFLMLEANVFVHRNDDIDVDSAVRIGPTHLVISPGPGRPSDAGISLKMIEHFSEKISILGVCLVHHCIVESFGGKIVSAQTLMHGKTSKINHDGKNIYKSLSNPLQVGRYHSLAAQREDIPKNLVVTAKTEDGEIMGVRHKTLPIEGVQFHPESVLTPDGQHVLSNFLFPNKHAQ